MEDNKNNNNSFLEKNNLPMYHGKATDTLANINSNEIKVNPLTGNATLTTGDVKIAIKKFSDLKSTLGINTHKILSIGIAKFTNMNNAKNSINYTVQLSLKSYAQLCGYDVIEHETSTSEDAEREKQRVTNTLKDVRKKIKKELDTLASIELTWTETLKGKIGEYVSLSLIGSRGIRNGYIFMTFDPLFAQYLVQLPLTQYPTSLLGIDARNNNAYSLGLKLTEHYNISNNQKIGTATKLKIETLLEYTSLPTYEHICKTKKSWKERIKEPFERALDELKNKNILKYWRYIEKQVIKNENPKIQKLNYDDWCQYLIEFELVNAIDSLKNSDSL